VIAVLDDLPAEKLALEITARREELTRQAEPPDETLHRALALAAVTSRRTLGFAPYPVQIMGALAIAHGFLAEMATGEGKTLTVALAAAVAGWGQRPVHVITANDYLAERDAENLRHFYQACGLTVGCVTGEMKPEERAENYGAAITYTTPKEVLADFLRDRLKMEQLYHPGRRVLRALTQRKNAGEDFVLRGLHRAILDEADNVLIDEAVTPLIISAQVENEPLRQACHFAAELAAQLRPGVDYDVDRKYRDIQIRQSAEARMNTLAARLPPMWRAPQRQSELLKLSLIAREFYHPGIHYVVQEGKLELVDEFTGRIMPNRTWQQGLQQAIEAKERLEISKPNETAASLSFQRFFRCYPRLAGVSGTAFEAAEELWQIYHLAVVRIPTHRPCLRRQAPLRAFSTEAEKWTMVLEEIHDVHATGRPVLVGTRSVRASEMLSEKLHALGLEHRLLNATRNREEAEIIRHAGERDRITIATNMAGRGTDIVLGPGVAELGGLHVIGTEMHGSGRVDRQLFGRAARQGDPGSAGMFASLEDDLIQRCLPPVAVQTLKEGVTPWLVPQAFSYAQRTAEKLAFRQRRSVLRSDRWLDENLSFAGKGASL
jgi:preprotein translocase subunit SecA